MTFMRFEGFDDGDDGHHGGEHGAPIRSLDVEHAEQLAGTSQCGPLFAGAHRVSPPNAGDSAGGARS
jgi:hypothetical protein